MKLINLSEKDKKGEWDRESERAGDWVWVSEMAVEKYFNSFKCQVTNEIKKSKFNQTNIKVSSL